MGTIDEATKDSSAPTKAEGPRGTPARRSERPSQRPGGANALIGTILSGRYRIERLLGEGGMGAVYQAEHTHMRKRLAVKVLHPEMSRLSEVVARFEREAMAAAHIDHPNVATATDFGKLEDGSFFLVLEFVEGSSLRDALAKGRLELGRALHVTRQIASALQRAHVLGIVHRDLKPENVMLVERDGDVDFVKVLDFGIAKVPVGELGGSGDGAPGQPVLTQMGMVYGTPEYMAPEQALGQPVDARADLYALGVMAYEMLTGVRPFDHESKVTLLGMHVTAPVPKMAAKCADCAVPPEVEALIGKLLAKEATERFADAKELIEAITTAQLSLASQGLIALPVSGSMPRPSHGQLPGPASSPQLASFTSHPDRSGAHFLPTEAAPASAIVTGLTSGLGITGPRAPQVRLLAYGGTALVGLIFAVVVAVSVATCLKNKTADPTAALGSGVGVRGSAGATAVLGEDPAGAPSGAISAAPDLPSKAKIEEEVQRGRAQVERGDYASAIETLSAAEKQDPARGDVQMLLWKSHVGRKEPKEAMKHADAWLKADPAAKKDLKLLEDVRNTALQREAQEQAFEILETQFGVDGVDVLYDVAYTPTFLQYPQAAARAKQSLAKPEVRQRASAPLKLALELRDAKTCDQRNALIVRAKDEGDQRVVPLMKQFLYTRGCGFLGRGDCFPCIKRNEINAAVQAIDARTKK